ncbi:MAG: hypothetical protein LBV76_03395, partial [Deltaproteobacteria bacterium]|nr:hypothetical protein [Deltaproteobacteria bacterium]
MTQQSHLLNKTKSAYALSDSLSPESFGGYHDGPPPDLPPVMPKAQTQQSQIGSFMGAPGGALGSGPAPARQAMPPAVPGSSQLQQAGAGVSVAKDRKAGALMAQDRKGLISTIFFKGKIDAVDLKYMTDVDAALHRWGSPRAYVISGTILAFFILFAIWAHFSMLDEVTRGMGQVVSSLPIQEI